MQVLRGNFITVLELVLRPSGSASVRGRRGVPGRIPLASCFKSLLFDAFGKRDTFEEVLRGSTPNGNQNRKHFIQMLLDT